MVNAHRHRAGRGWQLARLLEDGFRRAGVQV